ncbi:MAG: hypothetical protein MZV64_31475 [Ignavibacteriales bacterium]|nr:hypothetical protein [Ignavibacteriales bacterium]
MKVDGFLNVEAGDIIHFVGVVMNFRHRVERARPRSSRSRAIRSRSLIEAAPEASREEYR